MQIHCPSSSVRCFFFIYPSVVYYLILSTYQQKEHECLINLLSIHSVHFIHSCISFYFLHPYIILVHPSIPFHFILLHQPVQFHPSISHPFQFILSIHSITRIYSISSTNPSIHILFWCTHPFNFIHFNLIPSIPSIHSISPVYSIYPFHYDHVFHFILLFTQSIQLFNSFNFQFYQSILFHPLIPLR